MRGSCDTPPPPKVEDYWSRRFHLASEHHELSAMQYWSTSYWDIDKAYEKNLIATSSWTNIRQTMAMQRMSLERSLHPRAGAGGRTWVTALRGGIQRKPDCEELEDVLQKGQWSGHGTLGNWEGSIPLCGDRMESVCLDQILSLWGCSSAKDGGNDGASTRPVRMRWESLAWCRAGAFPERPLTRP